MRLGITLGDASGVGPEILVRTFAQGQLPPNAIVIGDRGVVDYCCRRLGVAVATETIERPEDAQPDVLTVLDAGLLRAEDIAPGEISRESGLAALRYLERAIGLALERRIDAIVTLPMNKEATRLSTPGFTGHTEVIARACGVDAFTMTLISDKLIVPHVTAHVSLRQALDSLSQERIVEVIRLADNACRRLGRGRRIAVMGVNPHAGEAGAFGDEEIRHVAPAVRQAHSEGIDAHGPLPPDTVFMRALRGEFDAVVCMYHDQGHIPMKTIGLDTTVNVTLGLPIVRTSVDHGTAFDIAYSGRASLGSFISATRLAARLAERSE